MALNPINYEVAATMGLFFSGGAGPTHAKLTTVFNRAGCSP